METNLYRYKKSHHNGTQEWKNDDSMVLDEHTETTGYKGPEQQPSKEYPICNTLEKNENSLGLFEKKSHTSM